MRVLLATDGTWGDVGPLLALASELRGRGHEVCALLNPSFAGRAERLGLAVERVGVSWEERLAHADPAGLMKPVSGTFRVLRDFLLPEIPGWAAAAASVTKTFRPDVGLVHHLSWGALWALHHQGLPLAACYLAPMALLSGEDPGRPLTGLPSPPRLVARANRRILKALFRRILDAPAAREFGTAGLPAARDLYSLAERTARVLLALWSPRLRGPAGDDPAGLRICGYAFPVEPDPLAPDLEAFLDAGAPPVVVTLGTSAREVGAALYDAAAEASGRIGRRAVLLTGASHDGAGLPDGVAAFDEAPHGRLMPRACAIVHHGGAGTCAQALRAGKPALIVPFGHDQADNAYRAQSLGGATIVSRRRASADRLARTLRAMLESEQTCASARRIGAILQREDGPVEAARLVETLAGGTRR